MVFSHRMLRIALSGFGLFSMLVILPGCPLAPGGGGDDDDDSRLPLRNSVTGAIEQYAFIWSHKLSTEYALLLHDDFEYFPQTADLLDFPWLGSAISWGRTDELQMAANMFNENFVSSATGQSVDSIDMNVTVELESSAPDGVLVRTNAVATVLWAENNGLRSEVRFEFLVVPDPDEPGLYQIQEQREQPFSG